MSGVPPSRSVEGPQKLEASGLTATVSKEVIESISTFSMFLLFGASSTVCPIRHRSVIPVPQMPGVSRGSPSMNFLTVPFQRWVVVGLKNARYTSVEFCVRLSAEIGTVGADTVGFQSRIETSALSSAAASCSLSSAM